MRSNEERKRFVLREYERYPIKTGGCHPLITESRELIKKYSWQFNSGHRWRAYADYESCKNFKKDFGKLYGLIATNFLLAYDRIDILVNPLKDIEDVNRYISKYHSELAFTPSESEIMIEEWSQRLEKITAEIENSIYNFYEFYEFDITYDLQIKRDEEYRLRELEKAIENKNRKQVSRKVRSTLQNMIRAAKCGGKNPKSPLLDFTPSDLIEQMESLFDDGMSWNNHGEWHVDHIKPVKAFLDEDVKDPAIINALENLQPLWAEDNLRKSARYETA